MALIVRSGIGKLRTRQMTQMQAAFICSKFALEGRSFYCEPLPDGQAVIKVDAEHVVAIDNYFTAMAEEACS